MADYRRPGVYIEEALNTTPFESVNATAVACFIGIAPKGNPQVATRIDSWSDFVQKFGGFDLVPWQSTSVPADHGSLLSYLPYAVYSFYQNGGHAAYIVRAMPSGVPNQGAVSAATITDGATTPASVLVLNATGAGAWGNDVSVMLNTQATDTASGRKIFSLLVTNDGQRVETFTNLSMGGIAGTRPVAQAINDPLAGSRFISVLSAVTSKDPQTTGSSVALAGGKDPALPTEAALTATEVINAVTAVEGPMIVSFQPFVNDVGVVKMPTAQQTSPFNAGRDDIFVVYDGNPMSAVASGSYTSDCLSRATSLGSADSYSALYAPWIIVPDPANSGGTISIPPSGAVTGIIARVDAQIGPWRAPAGVVATIANGLAAEVKFTETDQGQLNYSNINVIRGVTANGICVMGARTRKLWGPDRYVSARRVLIYIKESLRRSTQFAVFENNDANLWSAMRQTANRILNPIWEAGGLKGTSTADAYFIRCDATINTPQVVASGEVRMEVGVALQYPAEFILIKITQYDSGGSFAVADIAST